MGRFVLLCDLHLPEYEHAVQYDALHWAVEQIKEIKPDGVIVAGDMTARGERNALDYFLRAVCPIEADKVILLGNSDVRTEANIEYFKKAAMGEGFLTDDRAIICVNTPFGSIEPKDRERLSSSPRNAILVMHHSVTALEKDSRDFVIEWANQRVGFVLQAHSHKRQHYYISGTEVMGLCALDPEKAVGSPPGLSILEVDSMNFNFSQKFMEFPEAGMEDFEEYLGISCSDTERDIEYAIENKIYNIEIREYGGAETTKERLRSMLGKWREAGGRCLSLHMPNLRYKEGKFIGKEAWDNAAELALLIGADSLTVHVPRFVLKDLNDVWDAFLKLYVELIERMPKTTAIAIENLHAGSNEADDENRGFGYIPEEVMAWVDAINNRFGYYRVGHNLDVGHAKNNPPFQSKYTLGMWYAILGKRTEAYHIHQVRDVGIGSPNHKAITDWLGGQINYFSFFMAWAKGQLNHKPVFLEMRSLEDCDASMKAWRRFYAPLLQNKRKEG